VAPQSVNGDSSHTVRKLTTCKKELCFIWSSSNTKLIMMFRHWKPRIIMVTKISHMLCFVGRDSSVDVVYRYGLDRPGIESRRGRDFLHSSIPAQGPPSLLYNGQGVFFPGVKRPERGFEHPPLSSAEVKERVELYLYSPSGSSWPLLGRTVTVVLYFVVLIQSAFTGLNLGCQVFIVKG
jgi:hypothetical protein